MDNNDIMNISAFIRKHAESITVFGVFIACSGIFTENNSTLSFLFLVVSWLIWIAILGDDAPKKPDRFLKLFIWLCYSILFVITIFILFGNGDSSKGLLYLLITYGVSIGFSFIVLKTIERIRVIKFIQTKSKFWIYGFCIAIGIASFFSTQYLADLAEPYINKVVDQTTKSPNTETEVQLKDESSQTRYYWRRDRKFTPPQNFRTYINDVI